MDLAEHYIKNPYADALAYFSSNRFPPDDQILANCPKTNHGQHLSQWLQLLLKNKGFTVTSPRPSLVGWVFDYMDAENQWLISCENVSIQFSNEWKITVNSTCKNAQGEGGVPLHECQSFLIELKNILNRESCIRNVDWNLAVLNE